MKGYWNGVVYMGYVPSIHKYLEFLNEQEYREWYEIWENNEEKSEEY